jgi:hypothetical protein
MSRNRESTDLDARSTSVLGALSAGPVAPDQEARAFGRATA